MKSHFICRPSRGDLFVRVVWHRAPRSNFQIILDNFSLEPALALHPLSVPPLPSRLLNSADEKSDLHKFEQTAQISQRRRPDGSYGQKSRSFGTFGNFGFLPSGSQFKGQTSRILCHQSTWYDSQFF